MDLASIYFGLFLGLLVPTLTKVMYQTRKIWRRTRSFANVYLYFIWVEVIVNLIFSLATYLYLSGIIKPSLVFYFVTVTLWAIQTQLLSQIIANRVALIMVNKRKSRLLKWALFILITCINIVVYCIWIPAHLPGARPSIVHLNAIWERCEKSLFLLIDFGLNLYFLYLVRYRLIADGLTKYWPLFRFNAGIVFVSLSMDVLLLGMLSLPNPYDYVQFAPVAYIVKLYIELTMAVLISKVVRSSSAERVDDCYPSGNHTSNRNNLNSHISAAHTTPHPDSFSPCSVGMNTDISGGRPDCFRDEDQSTGIMKTVTMATVVKSDSGDDSSEGYQVESL